MSSNDKSKENYILKLKEELDNLSNRRQNMFNVSTVVMTVIIFPVIWELSFFDKPLKILNIHEMKIFENAYMFIVLSLVTFVIMLLTKHKYIAKIKYKILDDLILETNLLHYRYEYEILKDGYVNSKFNFNISKIEIIILYVFFFLPGIIIYLFNNNIKCNNLVLIKIYILFIFFNICNFIIYKKRTKGF